MKGILALGCWMVFSGCLHAAEGAEGKQDGKWRGYPASAATTEEILKTGLFLAHKNGTREPYVPKHTTVKSGRHELFFVWEMNPFGDSAVWLLVQGYTRTGGRWERFLSTKFEGVFGMAPAVQGAVLVLSERDHPNDKADRGPFYTRRLDTISTRRR